MLDASFVKKSGKQTYGVGNFYNGSCAKAEKGLEISTLAVVDVQYNTAYHVSTRQTPPVSQEKDGTRVTEYLRHFKDDCHLLPKDVCYAVTDAYYSKQLFTNGILACNYHQIGKLRNDANLRYLYTGEQKPRGRPKCYAGKIDIGDVSQLEFVEEKDGITLHTAVVNSVNLKRNIRIVFLTYAKGGYAVLFSTDTELAASTIYRYYKARFQIEFLFRDAKQFTGLCDSQARSETALHNHFNACFTALNIIKWHDRQQSAERKPISVSSWKTIFFNELIIERILSHFALDVNAIKSSPLYEELRHFGAIAC